MGTDAEGALPRIGTLPSLGSGLSGLTGRREGGFGEGPFGAGSFTEAGKAMLLRLPRPMPAGNVVKTRRVATFSAFDEDD